jgi:hypothetical protein
MQGLNVRIQVLGELTNMNAGFVGFRHFNTGYKLNSTLNLVLSTIPAFTRRLVLLAETCVQSVSAGIFDFYSTHKAGANYAPK